MSECNSCSKSSTCSDKENCSIEFNPFNEIGKVIGIMSGKGGVGKSTISAVTAKMLSKKGYKVGILDADITGPSIPRLLNVNKQKAKVSEEGILPVITDDAIRVMSLNLLIDDEDKPVIWRGPILAGTVKQFWTDVLWGDLDYLIVDLPPGTGDVPLTVMQSLPLNGIVMVSVPQDMVSMIVTKAIKMVREMNIDVLGIVENMSYIKCPNCNDTIHIFESQNIESFLDEQNLELLAEFPMSKDLVNISSMSDNDIEEAINDMVDKIIEKV